VNILLFEYFTAEKKWHGMEQGLPMLRALANSLSNLGNKVVTVSREKVKGVETVVTKEPFNKAEKILDKFDCVFLIAPEDKIVEMTKVFESESNLIGTGAKVLKKVIRKDRVYRYTKGTNFLSPNLKENSKPPFVKKPIVGCGTSAYLTDKKEGFVQEYVNGADMSISYIVRDREITPVSLNRQLVDLYNKRFIYFGNISPYRDENILEEGKKVIKKERFYGWVGLDIVVSDKVYLLEINPRVTFPYVTISKIFPEIARAFFEDIDIEFNVAGATLLYPKMQIFGKDVAEVEKIVMEELGWR